MKPIQRLTQEKDLEMAGSLVGTRSAMVEGGFVCLGTLSMAAQAGYYTHRVCAKMGQPVQPDEIPTHCAVMANCYAELCVVDDDGNRVRPCLPVFYREAAAVTTAKTAQKRNVCVDRIYAHVDRATKKVDTNA